MYHPFTLFHFILLAGHLPSNYLCLTSEFIQKTHPTFLRAVLQRSLEVQMLTSRESQAELSPGSCSRQRAADAISLGGNRYRNLLCVLQLSGCVWYPHRYPCHQLPCLHRPSYSQRFYSLLTLHPQAAVALWLPDCVQELPCYREHYPRRPLSWNVISL
ncbi:hypothetical protein DFJ58DRAFT_486271 [Suillus subalutaceus]|uniref:uncharacterized protein n=1 Tax=Suillus subalutaceus TaxID=48586 RepID=UPI001B85E834|nr:uncharacterized protein DFJ58DRAFT_486271 [Suillus subalutaceus]KAG1847206.1 hypothetical protein DFJ58DRAFT_486271 [Suillus subalutaceus]